MAKKRMAKRLLKTASVQWLLSHMAAFAMRFIFYTSRVSYAFEPGTDEYQSGRKNGIYVFWHGRLIMQPFMRPQKRRMTVLISQHNDGALITSCIKRFGIGAARGSKKKGGSEAVRVLVSALKKGDNISITPDGPRGPFQVAAPGAAYVAARTGYPVIPIAFSATRHWRLKSWDRFMIPKPFTRITFVAGQPFTISPEQNEAEATAALAAHITRVTNYADATCGVAA